VGSRTSGYSYSGVTIDTAECKLVFYAIWTTGGLPPGNGLIATIYFKTAGSWGPDIGEIVDSIFFPPENHLEFTKASTGIGFTPMFQPGVLGGIIEIIKPKKGDIWKEGETHNIVWSSVNFEGNVNIEFSTNDGQEWNTIAENTPSQGEKPWVVPSSSTGRFTIKVANATTGSPSQIVEGSTVDYVPGKLFVTFKDQSLPINLVNKSVGISTVDSLINQYGVSDVYYLFEPDSSSSENIALYNSLNMGKHFIFKGADTLDMLGLCDALKSDSSVETAVPVPILDVLLTPCDSLFPQQRGLENPWYPAVDIWASQGWEENTGDTTVIVSIIDSGIHHGWNRHPDFLTYYYENGNPNTYFDPIYMPYGYYWDDSMGFEDWASPFRDDFFYMSTMHGTCVAGIIGAEADSLQVLLDGVFPEWKCSEGVAGINWKVRLMPINITRPVPYGDYQYIVYDGDYAVEAIKRAADKGANVINMSWGILLYPWTSEYINFQLKPAIQYAYNKGAVLVAAMGNDLSGETIKNISYPAAFDEVIAVGAVDSSGNRVKLENYNWESKYWGGVY
jgi:hypothetical protein